MSGYTFALTCGAVAVIGVAMYVIVQKAKTDKTVARSKVLEDCFGAPMRTSTFTFSEVKDWILSHKNHLANGAKAIVMKVNDDTLRTLGKDLDIGSGLENILVIAVVNNEKNSIIVSTLVQYDTLDANLENALAKGNGVLVVEG